MIYPSCSCEGSLSGEARTLEAILFVAGGPVSVAEMAEFLSLPPSAVTRALSELQSFLTAGGHGIVLRETAKGWRMMTSEDVADTVARFRDTGSSQKIRLSKAAVETLAVIAYNQPVTRGEVEDIRGVRCERVIDTLLTHGIIRIAGRRKGTGSPLLYRTTDFFLESFGLTSISELPTLEELKELSPENEDDLPDGDGEWKAPPLEKEREKPWKASD